MKPHTKIRLTLALISAAFLVASCASPPPKSAGADEYEDVYETGSNLPKRVKKKHPGDATAGSQVQTVSAQALAPGADTATFKPPPGVK